MTSISIHTSYGTSQLRVVHERYLFYYFNLCRDYPLLAKLYANRGIICFCIFTPLFVISQICPFLSDLSHFYHSNDNFIIQPLKTRQRALKSFLDLLTISSHFLTKLIWLVQLIILTLHRD